MKRRLVLAMLAVALAPGAAHSAPYSYLAPGYVQELYAIAPGATSFAFASDGDLWVLQGNVMIRYDAQTTSTKNGTLIHPAIATVSLGSTRAAIANHPDGNLYLFSTYLDYDRTMEVRDISSGALLRSRAGCGGYQAAADPQAGHHVAVASDGYLFDLDPATLLCGFTEGLYWQGEDCGDVAYDPSGGGLVLAVDYYYGEPGLAQHDYEIKFISGSDYSWTHRAVLPAKPLGVTVYDGIHNVVTQLEDGTLYVVDPTGDWNNPLPASLLASGGFAASYPLARSAPVRTDPNGCLMVLQRGARYDDGTETSETSIVRICPEAVPTQTTTWGRLKAGYR